MLPFASFSFGSPTLSVLAVFVIFFHVWSKNNGCSLLFIQVVISWLASLENIRYWTAILLWLDLKPALVRQDVYEAADCDAAWGFSGGQFQVSEAFLVVLCSVHHQYDKLSLDELVQAVSCAA